MKKIHQLILADMDYFSIDMAKNIIVEVYFNKLKNKQCERRCLITKSFEEVNRFLSPLIPIIEKEDIINNLIEQREDPNKFPNVILFLEIKNELISFNEFIKD